MNVVSFFLRQNRRVKMGMCLFLSLWRASILLTCFACVDVSPLVNLCAVIQIKTCMFALFSIFFRIKIHVLIRALSLFSFLLCSASHFTMNLCAFYPISLRSTVHLFQRSRPIFLPFVSSRSVIQSAHQAYECSLLDFILSHIFP